MYRLIEISGDPTGRFNIAVPPKSEVHDWRGRSVVVPLPTSPYSEILIRRFEQAKFAGRNLAEVLECAVEKFFEIGVGSQVATQYHVQYKHVPIRGNTECVQGLALITSAHCWVVRACARSNWNKSFFLLHWNGPDEYSESLVVPILDTFEPMDENP